MHSKTWNALPAFRIRSHTTTATPQQHVAVGSLRAPPALAATTLHAAGQLDHCLSTGVDVYRHSPPHKSEPVVTYLIGLHKGGDNDPNRDAGVASGGGGRLRGGIAIPNPGFAQPGEWLAAPISSSSAVDPVIAIGRADIPQSARQQRSAACRV